MTVRPPARNMGASVRQRLLNLSRAGGQPFNILLTRYVLERLLYRLTLSPHAGRFVLKGAMLVTTWFPDPHRQTRDVDLLGIGDQDPDAVLAAFQEICAIQVDDGVEIDAAGLRVNPIREALENGGLRLRTTATVASARVNIVIDVGFGDATEPGIEDVVLPVLLDQPAPRLLAYARETVIAEKFQAMVVLGLANSRFKDFYDLWVLSHAFTFDDGRLARAIRATFDRRRTDIPALPPDALTQAFAGDAMKRQQWANYIQDLGSPNLDLSRVTSELATFLMPHARQARDLP
ncbi:MAG: nucleotidyl transferase AbiEii/AbiGii toxin family protein [Acetobacteraceae bacterium]|nr:nucleotidyl transferase AbiEii/AbiGii toxin family protein [Acetobacteraceae bacterium]